MVTEPERLKLEYVSHRAAERFLIITNRITNIEEVVNFLSGALKAFSSLNVKNSKLKRAGIIYWIGNDLASMLVQQIGETDLNYDNVNVSRYFCIDGEENNKGYTRFHEYLRDIVHPRPVLRLEPEPELQPTH
jgi:hypothetical protein